MTKEEILNKHLNVMLVEHSNDYKTVEVMSEQPEYKIILEAMEEYALQQVKNSGIIPLVVNSLPEPLGEMRTLGGIKYTDKDYSDWRKSNYATLSEYLQSIS